MILAVDIGNTKVTLGLYEKTKMVNFYSFVCPRNIMQESLEGILSTIFPSLNIENCIISSVVDELTNKVSDAISSLYHVNSLVLNADMNIGIKIKSHNPERIGTDRIANACAVSKLYNKRPIIVVDSGSATTFDIVDNNGDFVGGLIMPGLDLQLKSLSEKTSKLPRINLDMMDRVQKYINTDTQKGILSGVVFGHAQAIQGLITRCEKELKAKAFVVGTGGNASLLSKYMKYRRFDIINPTLTLDGINIIYGLNMD